MDVENAVGERIDEGGRQQAHESGEAHQVDLMLVQGGGEALVECRAGRPSAGGNDPRVDAGRPRAIQAGGVRDVRDHDGDARAQPLIGDGVDDRLQVRPAPRDQYAQSFFHKGVGSI